jgi:hypothetical protein
MVSWMKRRINRSRARCHKEPLAKKDRLQREQSEVEQSKRNSATPRVSSHHVSDK